MHMPDLVIVGTIALDTVKTPFGKVKDALGGSATYASLAASYFTEPGVVSVIGQDFPAEHAQMLKARGIGLENLQQAEKTFRWSGSYQYDMSEAETKKTELNALLEFKPELPTQYRAAKYLFLANFDPDLQLPLFDQVGRDTLVLLDTMNLWISTKRDALIEVIKKSDIVLLNDGEARQLWDTPNLVKAARLTLEMGPQYVIIKKGEHGALLFGLHSHFSAPGYPLEEVKDPTGAGDSFAGGLIGYLASVNKHEEADIRRGMIYGSAIASFCAEDFSVGYREKVNQPDLDERFAVFKKIRDF